MMIPCVNRKHTTKVRDIEGFDGHVEGIVANENVGWTPINIVSNLSYNDLAESMTLTMIISIEDDYDIAEQTHLRNLLNDLFPDGIDFFNWNKMGSIRLIMISNLILCNSIFLKSNHKIVFSRPELFFSANFLSRQVFPGTLI